MKKTSLGVACAFIYTSLPPPPSTPPSLPSVMPHLPRSIQVNATGVMPLIFASSLLALPTAVARYTDAAWADDIAKVCWICWPWKEVIDFVEMEEDCFWAVKRA